MCYALAHNLCYVPPPLPKKSVRRCGSELKEKLKKGIYITSKCEYGRKVSLSL